MEEGDERERGGEEGWRRRIKRRERKRNFLSCSHLSLTSILHQNFLLPLLLDKPTCVYVLATGTNFFHFHIFPVCSKTPKSFRLGKKVRKGWYSFLKEHPHQNKPPLPNFQLLHVLLQPSPYTPEDKLTLVNIQSSGKYSCFIPYIPLPNARKVKKLTGYNRTL